MCFLIAEYSIWFCCASCHAPLFRFALERGVSGVFLVFSGLPVLLGIVAFAGFVVVEALLRFAA